MPEQWHQWKFPLKPILDQALRWHASTINLKSSRIPADWKPAFDEVPEADRVSLRAEAAGISLEGVARRDGRRQHVVVQCRRRARLWQVHVALAIGDNVVPLDADVRQWLPGDSLIYENTIAVPYRPDPGL